jgi:hypothetical protein
MADELDAELTRLFAHAREPLTDGEFVARVVAKIERARRARLWRQLLAIAAVVIVASLNLSIVLEKTALLVHAVGEFSSAYAELFITPAGWAMSMLIGALALLRTNR